MKDEEYLRLILRAYISNQITQAEAIEYIFSNYSSSKRFNAANFWLGATVGAALYILANIITQYI